LLPVARDSSYLQARSHGKDSVATKIYDEIEGNTREVIEEREIEGNAFITCDQSPSFILLDWGSQKQIRMNHFSWQTHNYPENYAHLKQIYVQGSNDKNSCELIAFRNVGNVLNGNKKFCSFECTLSAAFRCIRFLNGGRNWQNDSKIGVFRIEIFGQIIETLKLFLMPFSSFFSEMR
jgi:hypothetical protein